jgi:uncharacterized membrane protein YcaP (DUF421 family)
VGVGVDWRAVFVPSGSLIELVVRGSIMYLLLLAGLRVFRREPGSLGIADLLVVVIIADAAQNALSGQYTSVTEGAVLVATIFGWDFLLDWLAYRYRWMHRLLHPKPLLLVVDGKVQWKNLKSELLTEADLMEQLREQGVARLDEVRRCYVESDGQLSVLRYQQPRSSAEPSRKREQPIG